MTSPGLIEINVYGQVGRYALRHWGERRTSLCLAFHQSGGKEAPKCDQTLAIFTARNLAGPWELCLVISSLAHL